MYAYEGFSLRVCVRARARARVSLEELRDGR
jgi:hypothetical protein